MVQRYPCHMTLGDREILCELVNGHTINFLYFHLYSRNGRCGCDECVISRLDDSLRHSRSRINAYRALASPSLIGMHFT